MEMRPYQEEAYHACLNSLDRVRSSLCVMATGLGKTTVFSNVAKDWDGQVAIGVHRDELAEQALATLERITGEEIGLEKGGVTSLARHRIVVCSIQSMNPKRLERLGRTRFQLLIPDEGHRYAARTYKRFLDYFDAKVLGFTATPDRGDGKALGMVFDEVAYVADISDGIEWGYLVPIRYRNVKITSVDLSGVPRAGADLSEAGLDEVILKGVEGIVKESIRLGEDRQAIAFWPGTRSAAFATDRYNTLQPGSTVYIDADTKYDVRRQAVSDFKAGKFKRLCNVGIATEGFDAPGVSLIIGGRPTTSRQLAAQMVGRGTRTLPGVVDRYPNASQATLRREAIQKSSKPDCLVLDFVANSGKHKLVTPVDMLGGRYGGVELDYARKRIADSPEESLDVGKVLTEAKVAMAQVAATLESVVESTVLAVDPFSVLHLKPNSKYTERFGYKPASASQKEALRKQGLPDAHLATMKSSDAAHILNAMAVRRSKGLASYRQLRMLRRYGIDEINISFKSASRALDYIASTGYGKKEEVMGFKVRQALGLD